MANILVPRDPSLTLRLAVLPLLALLGACGGGEPTTSYCEAVCDWAVGCADEERPVDAAALTSSCLAATRDADDGCARAEDGSLNPAARQAVDGCVAAIGSRADEGECDSFTGRIDDLKTATAPAACAATGPNAQATFQAAQEAVIETGDALCGRFTETFCFRLDECVIADLGTIPQPVVDRLGTPFEMCVDQLSFQTDTCRQDDLYLEEEGLTDANLPRQAARECLRDFSAVACGDLLSGEVPELCAGSFVSVEDSVAFATALFNVAQQIQQAVAEHEEQ